MDVNRIAQSILALPPAQAAQRMRSLARLAPGVEQRLLAWARLPDDQLGIALQREAASYPLLAPIASQALSRPDWLRGVAQALRPGKGRGL